MPRPRLEPLLIGLVLTGVGIWLLDFSWSRLETDRRLNARSAVTEGRVLDGSTRELTKGGQSSLLIVEYLPENQSTPITREFDVDGTAYRAGMKSGKATVTYLPEDPKISRLMEFPPLPYQILLGIAGLSVLGGLVSIAIFLKRRGKEVPAPTGSV